MKTTRFLAALVGVLGLAACGDALLVPDLNNPSLDDLATNPTRSNVATAAQGLLIGARAGISVRNGYVSLLGILGRESYVFDPADPRFVTEMLEGTLDPGSNAFGANHWLQRYRNLRGAAVLLAAADKVGTLSDSEKEAVRGFAKTMMALDLLLVVNTRDENGAVVVFDAPVREPAPLVKKPDAFAEIGRLLDEGKTHLQRGGSSFPFRLSSGFADFDTPDTFLQLNRALRARVAVYMASMNIGGAAATNWQAALTALGESFLSTSKPLDFGAYHVFSTNAGDLPNTLFDPVIFAHQGLVRGAATKANGQPDDRLVQKTVKLAQPARQRGLETDLAFSIYPNLNASVAIIRNEELILLRAEANIGLGNVAAAAQDLNFIRESSGGLSARADLTAANILDELLYNRRYSLLFEGHGWIDLRRYGRLTDAIKDLPSHTLNRQFPVPTNECLARGLSGECRG